MWTSQIRLLQCRYPQYLWSTRIGTRSIVHSTTPPGHTNTMTQPLKLIDIGANLTDTMYQGVYGGKQYHPPDLDAVLNRAWAVGVERIIITAGNLQDAHRALELASTDDRLYCTVGCHPTRCTEFDQHPEGPQGYLNALRAVAVQGIKAGKCVALGELGLDYDRLHFCDADTQRKYFPLQLQLASELQLPLFLHSRAAAGDFLSILTQHIDTLPHGGVVHSFDGTPAEAASLVQLPTIAIGINGCSLKTQENVDTVATIPLERLMLETDAPWCDIRPSHASYRYIIGGKGSSGEGKGGGGKQKGGKAGNQAGAGGKPGTSTIDDTPKTTIAPHTANNTETTPVVALPPITAAVDRKKHSNSTRVKGRNEPESMMQVLQVVAGCRGEDVGVVAGVVYNNTMRMFFERMEERAAAWSAR